MYRSLEASLHLNSSIVHSRNFELGINRSQDSRKDDLTKWEKSTFRNLLLENNTEPDDDGILKRPLSQQLYGSKKLKSPLYLPICTPGIIVDTKSLQNIVLFLWPRSQDPMKRCHTLKNWESDNSAYERKLLGCFRREKKFCMVRIDLKGLK